MLSFLIVLGAGCSSDESSPPIPPDTFASIYTDVLVASEMSRARSDTVNVNLDSIYAYHGVVKSLVDSTVQWYEKHPDAWNDLLDRVAKNVEAQLQADTGRTSF
ncbi:MAG: DUF4296 domain-containing protein [Chlorobi bacterium]|nr:DUF4296 domain-containing protein [Chlorobiota bacterium]